MQVQYKIHIMNSFLPHSTQKVMQCPLFQDPEEDVLSCEEVSEGAGVNGIELKPGDPYYEMKFEKFNKKVHYYYDFLSIKLHEWNFAYSLTVFVMVLHMNTLYW